MVYIRCTGINGGRGAFAVGSMVKVARAELNRTATTSTEDKSHKRFCFEVHSSTHAVVLIA